MNDEDIIGHILKCIFWYQKTLLYLVLQRKICQMMKFSRHLGSGVATGGWVGPDPPLLFRPLLRFAQIRWEVFYVYRGGGPMHVYCNILLLTSNNKKFGPPLFRLATPLHLGRPPIFEMDAVLRSSRQPTWPGKVNCSYYNTRTDTFIKHSGNFRLPYDFFSHFHAWVMV